MNQRTESAKLQPQAEMKLDLEAIDRAVFDVVAGAVDSLQVKLHLSLRLQLGGFGALVHGETFTVV